MNNAVKTNLKKLKFLGFGTSTHSREIDQKEHKNCSGKNSDDDLDAVQLDEECAKVFAMDADGVHTSFDIQKIHTTSIPVSRSFSEKDNAHQRNSFLHRHPNNIYNSPHRRQFRSNTKSSVAYGSSASTSNIHSASKVGSCTCSGRNTSKTNSDVDITPTILHEANDISNSSGDSDCVFSDPCGFSEMSPENDRMNVADYENTFPSWRKVQFAIYPEKMRKSHHNNDKLKGYPSDIQTSRKLSLPDDTRARRVARHHKYGQRYISRPRRSSISHRYNKTAKLTDETSKSGEPNLKRRVSTQPEDLHLIDVDREQLDSHRSDDARGLRRYRTSRLSNASLIQLERKKGRVGGPSFKKMYDHRPHSIFVELAELSAANEGNVLDREWKETARWIKYEEDVEEGVDRWGKPHVASLSFHSLLNLRKCLEEGLVLLDLEEHDLPAIAYRVSEDLYREELIREEDKSKIMRVMLLRHRHVNEPSDKGFRFARKHSYASLQNLNDAADRRKVSFSDNITESGVRNPALIALSTNNQQTHIDIKEETYSVYTSTEDVGKQRNETILKRIPTDSESCCILVGDVDFLQQPAIAFIRLAEGVVIPSLIEVNIPVRFIFILLGPANLSNLDYHEVGRSISTLMSNQQFHNIAYGAYDRKALLSAINEFLDDSIVLPPGDWDRQALLPIDEIKAKSEMIKKRKLNALNRIAGVVQKETDAAMKIALLPAKDGADRSIVAADDPLTRTCRPWGGLWNDLKRRYPHYKSDMQDGINIQCMAASIFMYFAALSGAVAFGGLMSAKTDNWMGISETLVCTCVSGVLFALLSGQPLVIVGSTGPLLLFDQSLFEFCTENGIPFLGMRVYIGIWLGIIGLLVAGLEGSVLVKLFTRFTEDIFSALIVLLYIMESLVKLLLVYSNHPLLASYCVFYTNSNNSVSSFDNNYTENISLDIGVDYVYEDNKTLTLEMTTNQNANGKKYDAQRLSDWASSQPNTALFCTILTLGTFAIAYYLKMFRNSQFLGRSARRALGDFGVPIAIVMMVIIDYMTPQTYTEKLNVPNGLSPSKSEDRGWFIPLGSQNQVSVWMILTAGIPAMLVYILLFMETHIAELIIDKKERKLKKGSGFHLDIVLICLINTLCGTFGLPWICAATVRSIAHVSALTVMSRTHAPGEKPHLVEVKEQRISALAVSILVGLSVLMAPILRRVPMAVLCGVFLYMGVASIEGIQFFDRIKLLFMPVKHHPQASYVRKVKTFKMHLYTFVQLMCLVVLWIVKSTKASLAFPFFLVLLVPLRTYLTFIFSQRELRALDGDQGDVDEDDLDFYAEAPLPG